VTEEMRGTLGRALVIKVEEEKLAEKKKEWAFAQQYFP